MSVDFSESFSIAPATARVKSIRALAGFINEYPDEELTPNLLKLNEKYQYYRPICGDGNCFYRACVFLYFSHANLKDFNRLFPSAPIKNCRDLPFDLEEYNVGEVLKYIWKDFLLPLAGLDIFQRQKQLLRSFNSSVLFDSFLIAYFRSLNHGYLQSHRQQFSAYIQGDVSRAFEQVLNFGRQSEGIELFAMAEQLKVKITIMMVHKENFQQINYRQQGQPNFVLFYRPGHYDILCKEGEYRKESSFPSHSKPALNTSNTFRTLKPPPEEVVVKINSIADMNKYKPSQSGLSDKSNSSQRKSSPKEKSLINFYEKASPIRRIDKVLNEIDKSPSSPLKKEERSSLKQSFSPASVPLGIPNVDKKKMLIQASALIAVVTLVILTASL